MSTIWLALAMAPSAVAAVASGYLLGKNRGALAGLLAWASAALLIGVAAAHFGGAA
jgi:hypothetical protein